MTLIRDLKQRYWYLAAGTGLLLLVGVVYAWSILSAPLAESFVRGQVLRSCLCCWRRPALWEDFYARLFVPGDSSSGYTCFMAFWWAQVRALPITP